MAEGQTVVGQLAATDADHAAADLAWSIPAGSAGGADAAHFTLSAAGALAFAAAKDHENPDDANTDGVYALTVQVSDGANPATADLTVTLTDVAPAVSIAPVAASVVEGTAAAFTLTRSGDLSGTQAVAVDVSQTGAVLATGQAGARQVTFADGATAAALSATTDDDTVAEAAGTVTATVQTGTGYTVGASATAHVTVTDNDAAALTLTVQPSEIAESDAATAVTVTAAWDAGTRAEATAVTVSVGGGSDTATAGTDYAAVPDLSLLIAAGAAEAAATFTLTPTADAVDETDEALTVSATTSVTGLTVTGATLTITDDDERGMSVSPTELTVREGGTGTYEVKLTSQPTDGVTVTLTASGDATVDAQTLSFTATDWSTARTVTVSGSQDPDAAAGSASITHTADGGDYQNVAGPTVAVTVTDDDTASTAVTLSLDDTEVAEDSSSGEPIEVTATLDGATLGTATAVTVSVAGGTATAGDDFTAVDDVTVTIAAGEASGTGTFTLAPVDDAVDEADETVTVSATTTSGLTVRPTAGLTVTITDDDTRGVTVSATELTVREGGTGTYEVELDSQPTDAVDVTVTASGDATVDPGTLSFTTTDWSTARTVTVSGSQDPDAAAGSASITHTADGGDYQNVAGPTVAVTVTDDDTASTAVTLSLDDTEVAEDSSSGEPIEVTATLDGATLGTATAVTVSVAGGTATAGDDFTAVDDVTVTIAAGEASGTGTFTLAPVNDDVDEADETVTVSATTTSGLTVRPTAGLTVTITDDDTRGVSVSQTALTVREGGTGTYEVELDSQPTDAVTVTVTASGDATVDAQTLSFTAGDWSAAQTVTVTGKEDADSAPGEATIAHVANGGDYVDVAGDTVNVTVTDDDTASTAVTLSVNDTEVAEDSSSGEEIEVTATLDGAARGTATDVTVTVAGGTATAGDDFTAVDDVTVTIAAGEASGTDTFTLTPVNDDVDEADETVTVSATTTSGLTVRPTAGLTVTITDDDTRGVSVSQTALTVREGGTGTYEVELDSQPTDAVTVTVTASGDATVDAQTLSFTAGDWSAAQTVTVTGKEDADSAPGEATIAHVANGGDYVDVAGDTVNVTVTDDDTASTAVTLSVNDTEVAEDSSSGEEIEVTATLDGAALGTATDVTVSVTGGTATAGDDFAAVDDVTVTIAAGEASGTGTFTLAPVDDDVDEADETVTVSGTTTSGLTVTPTAGLTVTITDDDERGVTATPHELTVRKAARQRTR